MCDEKLKFYGRRLDISYRLRLMSLPFAPLRHIIFVMKNSTEKTLRDFIQENAAKDVATLEKELCRDVASEEKARISAMPNSRDKAIEALKTVRDPEMSVNIWDLGLVYRLDVAVDAVHADMTLTAPTCPVAELIPAEAKKRLSYFFGDGVSVSVNLVWQPAWDKSRMTDEAKFILDMW